MAKILVVDDEENIRKVLAGLLKKNGYENVLQAPDGLKALEIVNDENIDLIISDINMPVMTGLELFEEVKKTEIPFIILTAYGTIETAVNATKNGVYDFIAKPFDEKNLIDTVNKALKEHGKNDLEISSGGIDELFFYSENPEMLKIKENMGRVINTRAGILIIGETGTGKGLLASVIHFFSPDKDMPFIKVNCAAIPSNLLESELFGYARGAFTGAMTDKPGKFELADGGTIFLDEIGDLDMDLQAKMLCAIQDKEITRLGDTKPKKVDLRIVAATNIDIPAAIAAKKFREDLYYRLNVVEFKVPPLRERKDDIEPIAAYFAGKYAREYDVERKTFDHGAIERMKNYGWPGNVRELENVVQKLTIMEKDTAMTASMLDNYIKKPGAPAAGAGPGMLEAGREQKAKKEAELINEALLKTGGNKTKAAELLGISRRTLLYRIKEYGL